MLQKIKNRKSEAEGFTIIEVLIVLAIAGLILLIVFLAVPALQRNSRNTERKNDVSSLGSAISEFVDNNSGTPPASSTDEDSIMANWKPGFYSNGSGTAANSSVTFSINTGAKATADPADINKINVGTYSTCSGNASTATGATPRSIAITYDVETGGGKTEQCITAN